MGPRLVHESVSPIAFSCCRNDVSMADSEREKLKSPASIVCVCGVSTCVSVASCECLICASVSRCTANIVIGGLALTLIPTPKGVSQTSVALIPEPLFIKKNYL